MRERGDGKEKGGAVVDRGQEKFERQYQPVEHAARSTGEPRGRGVKGDSSNSEGKTWYAVGDSGNNSNDSHWQLQQGAIRELGLAAKRALVELYKREFDRISEELHYQKSLHVFLEAQSRLSTKNLMLKGITDKEDPRKAILALIESNRAYLAGLELLSQKKLKLANGFENTVQAYKNDTSDRQLAVLTKNIEAHKEQLQNKQACSEQSLRQSLNELSRSQSSFLMRPSQSMSTMQSVSLPKSESVSDLKSLGLARTKSSQVLLPPMELRDIGQPVKSSAKKVIKVGKYSEREGIDSFSQVKEGKSDDSDSMSTKSSKTFRTKHSVARIEVAEAPDFNFKKKPVNYPKLEILCHDYGGKSAQKKPV